jgi:hypothetical protein
MATKLTYLAAPEVRGLLNSDVPLNFHFLFRQSSMEGCGKLIQIMGRVYHQALYMKPYICKRGKEAQGTTKKGLHV